MAYSRILALASRSASDLSASVILAARRRISVALMVTTLALGPTHQK